MGQISVTISAVAGSVLSDNQRPKDESPATKAKRVLPGLRHLEGITFAARIMVEPASNPQYRDQNRIANVVLPGEPQHAAILRGESVAPDPVNAPARKPAAASAPGWQAPAPAWGAAGPASAAPMWGVPQPAPAPTWGATPQAPVAEPAWGAQAPAPVPAPAPMPPQPIPAPAAPATPAMPAWING